MSAELQLAGLEQTEALGRRLGEAVRAGDLILLEGPLGAGKTALVRALAAGLGCADEVVSPTFVLVRHHRGRLPLVHADLYRLQDRAAIDHLGLLELAEGGVLAVEWAERASWLDDDGALRLRLGPGRDEDARLVQVLASPPHLAAALRAPQ